VFLRLLVLSSVMLTEPKPEKPRPLLAFEESRKSLVSGDARWTVTIQRTEPSDEPVEIQYVSRYARNRDWIVEQRGDQHGWTEWRDPEYRHGENKFPLLYLSAGSEFWQYRETGMLADYWKNVSAEKLQSRLGHRYPPDIRFLGASSTESTLSRGLEDIWSPPRSQGPALDVEWHEARLENGLYAITVKAKRAPTKTTWHIDPEKGWNPVRVFTEQERVGTIYECRSSLKKWNGIWFPETTSYYIRGKPVKTFMIRSFVFNQAADPTRFSPTDIGMEPGINVTDRNREPPEMLYWTEEGLVGEERWYELIKQGKGRGPRMLAKLRGEYKSPYRDEVRWQDAHRQAQLRVHRSAIEAPLDEWGRFVQEFIARHGLSTQQEKSAIAILTACRSEARRHIETHQAEYAKLGKALVAAGTDRQRIIELHRSFDELHRPVNALLDARLRPRLLGLLTESQRNVTSTQEATSR